MEKQKIIQALSGNLIEVAVGFATIMFLTRNFDQEQTGIYFLIMAIVAVLNNLKEGFMQNGFVKFYVESGNDQSILKSGLILTYAWDLVNMLSFSCIALFNKDLLEFLPFYYLQTVTYSHYRWLIFVHKSEQNLGVIFKANILTLISSLSGLFVIYLWKLPITHCLLVAGIAFAFAAFSLPENRVLFRSTLGASLEIASIRQIAQFGKFGLLKELAGSISHQSGIFLSAYFLTLGDTALLGLANRYAVLIAIPGSSISGLIYPVLLKVGLDPKKLKLAARDGIGKMYALLIPMAVVICISSPFLIMFLHGSAYGFAAVILIIRVLLTSFLLPMGTGFSSVMNVMNQPGKITKLVIVTSLVNLLTMVLSMPVLGIWGAVLCPVLTEFVGFMIMRKGLIKIDLKMSEIAMQIMHFWKFWIKHQNPFTFSRG